MTTVLIPTLIVGGLFVAWSLRVTLSSPEKLIAKAVVACLSLALAIACAIGAMNDEAPHELGLVAVFIAVHISAVISYTAGQILARLDSRASSEAQESGRNQHA